MPNFISPSIIVSNLCRSKSDTEIDYGKLIIALIKVHFSFMLRHCRETVVSRIFVREFFLGRRNHERSSLEEYENAESLPEFFFSLSVNVSKVPIVSRLDTSSQRIWCCFTLAQQCRGRYVRENEEPVDYMHVLPRTPRVLQIHAEEENWIKGEQEDVSIAYRINLAGRFMKKSIGVEGYAIIFNDERFVCSWNLWNARVICRKVRIAIRKRKFPKWNERRKKTLNQRTWQDRDETRRRTLNNGNERTDGLVMSGKTSMMEKKSGSKTDDVDTFLPMKKNSIVWMCRDERGVRLCRLRSWRSSCSSDSS